jgi:hypothetical protein
VAFAIVSVSSGLLAQEIRWSKDDDRGNRFEGVVSFPRAKPGIQLISFTSYIAPLPRGRSQSLYVKFYAESESWPVIEARELTPVRQYRMESKPWHVAARSWSSFGPWPTGDVLLPHDLALEQLGVLVYLTRTSGAMRLAPAAIYYDTEPVLTHYTLKVKTSWPQSWLKCTVSKEGRSLDGACGKEQTNISSNQIATFEIDGAILPGGDIEVTLAGQDKNRDGGPVEEFIFFNKKQ